MKKFEPWRASIGRQLISPCGGWRIKPVRRLNGHNYSGGMGNRDSMLLEKVNDEWVEYGRYITVDEAKAGAGNQMVDV